MSTFAAASVNWYIPLDRNIFFFYLLVAMHNFLATPGAARRRCSRTDYLTTQNHVKDSIACANETGAIIAPHASGRGPQILSQRYAHGCRRRDHMMNDRCGGDRDHSFYWEKKNLMAPSVLLK